MLGPAITAVKLPVDESVPAVIFVVPVTDPSEFIVVVPSWIVRLPVILAELKMVPPLFVREVTVPPVRLASLEMPKLTTSEFKLPFEVNIL